MSQLQWITETLYQAGDEYFDSLRDAIDAATSSIHCEMYTFASDEIGEQIFDSLCKAAQRKVSVSIIVDAIGSSGWETSFGQKAAKCGIQFKVYHPARFSFIEKLNKRTHRKLVIIDQKVAFVGSRNFTSVHSKRIKGEEAWRDISIKVVGDAVSDLVCAFMGSWISMRERISARLKRQQVLLRFPELVRLNSTWAQRRRFHRELKQKIHEAKREVWIVTGYFIPPRRLARALWHAARRGVNVRVLISSKSDVFFIPWVVAVYSLYLRERGVLFYDYQPSVMHAKSVIIDDWMTIGSSNFNHRSIFHDQEVDVVLSHPESMRALRDGYVQDIQKSKELSLEELRRMPFLVSLFGKVLLAVRSLL